MEEGNAGRSRGIKYLGYTFKRNNSDEAHIREVNKKAAGVMAQIWGIGERKFGGDWDIEDG